MAKMFCTIPEAAKIMGVTEKRVRHLLDQGRLQEFKDRDRSMIKTEQVESFAEELKKWGDCSLGEKLLEEEYKPDDKRVFPDDEPVVKNKSPLKLVIATCGIVFILLIGFVFLGQPRRDNPQKIAAAPQKMESTITILIGDKVYKTFIVPGPVTLVNGGIRWKDEKGNIGYYSGQVIVETAGVK